MGDDKKLLTPEQAAEFLGIQPATLSHWRCTGRYDLPYVRVGDRSVRYRLSDLQRWIEARVIASGGEQGK